MTILTAYTAVLTGDSSMGSNYSYVLVNPITENGSAARITLRGPAAGIMVVSDAYIGHKGTGTLDFDGAQQPILVDGLATFTLGAGQEVVSDSLSINLTSATPVLITYDGIGGSGRAYRYADIAGRAHHYKTGSQGAANGANTRSGYTAIAGRTAVVVKIEVAGALSEFAEEAPPPEETPSPSSGLAQIFAGERFSGGATIAGESGKYAHMLLINPAASSRTVALYQADITPDADTVVTLRGHTGTGFSGQTALPHCNLMFASWSEPPKATAYKHQAVTPQAAFHGIRKLKGGWPYTWREDVPIAVMAPGEGAVLCIHTAGVGFTGNFAWREIVS